MMTANEIREKFINFFKSKDHQIVDSAPIVNKNDPSLMFTNAGMNQFKDYFLGNKLSQYKRIADTQKCLRVSGKHNDLEEVGKDSYHHTMFEMLGNWSFGNYFKQEAIEWGWELLTKEFGIDQQRLYASCFGGDSEEGLSRDEEAFNFWKNWLPEERILFFGKKDNFWEMGDSGPCGPCSEIHIDLRSDDERKTLAGSELVNKDHPQVVELWNLVFIQYNRKSDGTLEDLPEKHVDTGMGFERLCMMLQGKLSSYDTDLFSPFIQKIEERSGKKYGGSYEDDATSDIAMRVIADHLRAVSFTIADGELPGNTGAGYVIRRILRRAVRYYYSFLDIHEPFIYSLVELLAEKFEFVFPELHAQQDFVSKVVLEEEKSFLRTLEEGLKRLDNLKVERGVIDGHIAFELYDTFGFPIDLTRLIANEKGLKVDETGFEKALQEQKERSRHDARKVMGDWVLINTGGETEFIGYDQTSSDNLIVLRYRSVMVKDEPQQHLVLNKTPFYPEGGGQVGDVGFLIFDDERIEVLDTKKENDMIIHIVRELPENIEAGVNANVNVKRRKLIENNHSATHLLHAALRRVLGDHVHQRGSLVSDEHLRFDFSHFQKLSANEISKIEHIVNQKIRENVKKDERRNVPIQEAKESGARMLFGEKYGEEVRMIVFDPDYSLELCGGCHVEQTGQIGILKIVSESAIAAGVRRIEAITADKAEVFINQELEELNAIRGMFKNPLKVSKRVYELQEENRKLQKELQLLQTKNANSLADQLKSNVELINNIQFIGQKIPLQDMKAIKSMAYNLQNELQNSIILLGMEINEKAQLMLLVDQSVIDLCKINAGQIIREVSKSIQGGGGGQAFYATAGGKNPQGIPNAIEKAKEIISTFSC